MDTEQDDVIHELEAELLRRIESDDDGEQPDEQLLQPHGTLADLVGPLDSDADDDDDAADPTFSGADERAALLARAERTRQEQQVFVLGFHQSREFMRHVARVRTAFLVLAVLGASYVFGLRQMFLGTARARELARELRLWDESFPDLYNGQTVTDAGGVVTRLVPLNATLTVSLTKCTLWLAELGLDDGYYPDQPKSARQLLHRRAARDAASPWAVIELRSVCRTLACAFRQALSSTAANTPNEAARVSLHEYRLRGAGAKRCEATLYAPPNVTLPPLKLLLLGDAHVDTRDASRDLRFAALSVFGKSGGATMRDDASAGGERLGVRLSFLTIGPGPLNVSLSSGHFEGQALSLAPPSAWPVAKTYLGARRAGCASLSDWGEDGVEHRRNSVNPNLNAPCIGGGFESPEKGSAQYGSASSWSRRLFATHHVELGPSRLNGVRCDNVAAHS